MELSDLRQDIIRYRNKWKDINDNGCNDPFWPDGCNMNLLRNHILYDRHKIQEICAENGLLLPEEYFLAVPPEVDNNYMANLKQKERVQRIESYGTRITRKKTKFIDDGQLSFC